MINIRKEISKFFDEYSHNIVYVCRDTRFRCECYIERSGESDPDCSKCFGTSYVVRVETQRTRRKISSVPETLIGINQLQSYGNISPKAFVYYFEYFVKPKENDLILEVDWKQNLPIKINEIHKISAVEPKLGCKGRIEFYQVYCRYKHKGVADDEALSEY